MAMLFSICVWEGDLLGPAGGPPQSDCWSYGTMWQELWKGLPKEVLEMILMQKLPDSSKCRFRAVCRRWRTLLSSAGAFSKPVHSSPRLICKFYWGRDAEVGHCESWEPFKGVGEILTNAELEQASHITCGSSIVCKDFSVDLSVLPKLCEADNFALMDGLLCVVHGKDGFEPQKGDVYVVNPMNSTWRLLPKCDDSVPSARLTSFRVAVVVSKPPDCAFHVLVAGSHVKENGSEEHFTVLRYWSETNRWEAFGGDTDIEEEFDFNDRHFALSSTLLFNMDHRARTVNLYEAEEGAQAVSFLKYIRFPPCDDFSEVVGLVKHGDKIYFVGEEDEWGSHPLIIKELIMEEDRWVHVSSSPANLMDDYSGMFPGQTIMPWIRDYLLVGDILSITVKLMVVWDDQENEIHMPELPDQYVYYHLVNRTWYSGSRFFCSSSLNENAFHGEVLLDNSHLLFEPRLDIRL